MKVFSGRIKEMPESSVRVLTNYAVEAENAGKYVYRLNIGQPDLPVPIAYYRALRNIRQEVLAYEPSWGNPGLRDSIAGYYRSQGIDIAKEDVAITNGASEALLFTLLSITNPGDECLVFEPYYSNYNTFFIMAGTTPVPVTTSIGRGFHFAPEEIEAGITPKTKAILVTNPGNPTGAVLSMQELEAVAEIARRRDLFIIADEVYREIVFDGRDVSSFGLVKNLTDRLIIIDSISKRFAACGARIGMVVSKNIELMQLISKLCQGRLSVSATEQRGAIELFAAGLRSVEEIRDEFQMRRDTVVASLHEIPGVVFTEPEGAFYIMVKLPVPDAEAFLVWLLEEFEDEGETVMAAPADGFYRTEGLGKDEIRIAYVLESPKLVRAMDLLAKGLAAYLGRKQTSIL
jgi:aspartate aminotransferase